MTTPDGGDIPSNGLPTITRSPKEDEQYTFETTQSTRSNKEETMDSIIFQEMPIVRQHPPKLQTIATGLFSGSYKNLVPEITLRF